MKVKSGEGAAAVGDEDAVGDRKYIHSKLVRSIRTAEDKQRSAKLFVLSVLTKSVDWLWSRLQHVDEQGTGCLLDLAFDSRNPLLVVQENLFELLTTPSSAMSLVWWHYGEDDDMLIYVENVAQEVALSLPCQLAWKFGAYDESPFSLLRMLDPPRSVEVSDNFLRYLNVTWSLTWLSWKFVEAFSSAASFGEVSL